MKYYILSIVVFVFCMSVIAVASHSKQVTKAVAADTIPTQVIDYAKVSYLV